MTVYDQLAYAGRPQFYMSSPNATDTSLSTIYALTTNFTNTFQPIISGSNSAFAISASSTFSLTSSATQYSNQTIEMVVKLYQPTDEIPLLINSNGNGIFVYPNGIYVRVYCVDGRPTTAFASISDWNSKQHIIVELTDNNISLSVNDQQSVAQYTNSPLPVLNNISLGTLPSGFIAGIDGIAIYNTKVIDKSFTLNDKGQGYEQFSGTLGGNTTLFNNIRTEFDITINSSNFQSNQGTLAYFYNYQQGDADYFILNTDSKFPVFYNTNNGDWQLINYNTVVNGSGVITIGFASSVNVDFNVNLLSIIDGEISWHSPAIMHLTGSVIPPKYVDESIVNLPDGADLSNSSYSGTWTISESLPSNPLSIEIVFMPMSSAKTYVFYSADGQASYGTGGSISGYIAYLNGSLVTDLTGIKMNQWNHLILNKSSVTANTFFLNTNNTAATPGLIKYMIFTAYAAQLTTSQIATIYNILLGLNSIKFVEQPPSILEGNLDSGSPMLFYTYAWAIVGAGGT